MDSIKKRDWTYLIAGTALMAVGTVGFYQTAGLVAGGLTGIGILLSEWATRMLGLRIPLWLVNTVCNLPLFLFAWRKKGRGFVEKTVVASLLFSAMLYLAEYTPVSSADPLLAAVFGGGSVGLGLGLVLSADGTTGGVDLAATLLHMRWHSISVSRLIFMLDAVIIFAGMLSFGVERGLYAILAVFITERCSTWIMEGANFARGAWIISEKSDRIAEALLSELSRGVTAFSAKGKYTGTNRDVLFCVFSKKEVQSVKQIIMNIDCNAFFWVTDIREVLGEGFSES